MQIWTIVLISLNCIGAATLLGLYFGVNRFWCGLPQNELCTDTGADCCANHVGGDWLEPEYATCVAGYEPTTEPTSFLDCPNYKCVPTGAAKTDAAGKPLVADADSKHCLGNTLGGASAYLVSAAVAGWGFASMQKFDGPKIQKFAITWGVMSVLGAVINLLAGEDGLTVLAALALNMWFVYAASSLGKQIVGGTISAQHPTGSAPTAIPMQTIPIQAHAVPVQAQAVTVPASAVTIQGVHHPVATTESQHLVHSDVPVAAVTNVSP